MNQQPGPVSLTGAELPSDDVTGGRGLPPGLQEVKASGIFTAELVGVSTPAVMEG